MKKKTILIVIVVVLIAVILCSFLFNDSKDKKEKTYQTVATTTLEQIVSVTGKIKATRSIDLSFDRSGRVQGVYVKAGDKVYQGQLLVALENAEMLAQKKQAQASVDAQIAKLEELKRGARMEDVAISQTQFDKTKVDLDNIYLGAPITLKQAYLSTSIALNQTIYSFFNYNFSQNTYTLNYNYCNANAGNESNFNRGSLDGDLKQWEKEVNNLLFTGKNQTDLDVQVDKTKVYLERFLNYFNRLNDTLIIDCYLTETQKETLAANKTLMTTALSSLNTAYNNVVTLKNSIIAQKKNVDIYQKQTAYKEAPATIEQTAYQEAQLKSAQANLELIEAQLAKTYLFAPVAGTIGSVNYELGETVSLGKIGVNMISDEPFQIESLISESDIAKVKVDDFADVTLDAFGPYKKFKAKVLSIDTSETISEGISSYKTLFLIEDNQEPVKSGMTANIDIITARKENVIAIPNRLLMKTNGHAKVKVFFDGKEAEVEVQYGIKGNDGNTEIISGLKVGDQIVVEK